MIAQVNAAVPAVKKVSRSFLPAHPKLLDKLLRTFRNRGKLHIRQFMTLHGIPCDHIPTGQKSRTADHRRVAGKWRTYYLMHIGPFDNPVETWIREDHIKENPLYNP